MNCRHARGLFGAYWDDEITQAEREALESHFAGCDACRTAYEEFSRPLEAIAGLPRIEAASGFAERVLARVRHVGTAPDRLPRPTTTAWVPVTAAAALLLIAGTFAVPWLATRSPGRGESGTRVAARPPAVVQPADLRPVSEAVPVPAETGAPVATSIAPGDTLFDHSADVEFILDPVTLRRGQVTVSRQSPATPGERTIVSF